MLCPVPPTIRPEPRAHGVTRASIRLTPRRVPGQDRSRALVDAVLQASAEVLLRDGFEATQMAEIARVAGVSVGSLYQYFPSKESLVAALFVREREGALAYLGENLLECGDLETEELCHVLALALVTVHRDDEALWRLLLTVGPQLGVERKLDVVDGKWVDLFATLVRTRGAEALRATADVRAFALVRALDGVLHAAVRTRPELLASDALLEALSDLLAGAVLPRG